jgi:hypothetical protein
LSHSRNSRYTTHISNTEQWKEILPFFQAFRWLWDPQVRYQWALAAMSPGVKQLGRDADHSRLYTVTVYITENEKY